jgi:predicted short-subunit dehydrogenase-like oxidoreductase (DUF2520 family)
MKSKSEKKIRVGIVGNGNLAWHWLKMLQKSPYQVCKIYCRNKQARNNLSLQFKIKAATSLSELAQECNIIILCVSDDAINNVAKKLNSTNKDKIILHCSGSKPLSEIPKGKYQRGVIYPLMTFTVNDKIKYSEIPFFIEAENKKTLDTIRNFIKSISRKIYLSGSLQRKKIHLAAVIASNFSNHLLSLSHQYLEKNKILPGEMLNALLKQNLKKSFKMGPYAAQTGPAKRGDKKVLKEHAMLLKQNKALLKIYQMLSHSIETFKK